LRCLIALRYAGSNCEGSTTSQVVCDEAVGICDEARFFDASSQKLILQRAL
jgi:hypothetical protein